ncbi:MAG TPA: helix-turn-helix domain-containing protein [Candidatus Paceibacterota bacterium]
MTQISALLKELGLTSNQTYIYTYLAKKGKSKAGEIIKATGFHRNIVYGTLEELVDKRLVGSSKENGIFVYRILDPRRLVAEQEDRVRKAKDLVEELATHAKKTPPQEIVIYEGQKDFVVQARRAYEIMNPGGTARTLGISPVWHQLVGNEIGDELLKIHLKKGLKWKALAKKLSANDLRYIDLAGEYMEAKETPLVSDDTSGIEILEDRISIRSFVEPYFIVEIINPQLAKNYQRYFDFIWEKC